MAAGRAWVLALIASGLAAQDLDREIGWLIVDVRTAPVAVRSGGQYLIQYELGLSNHSLKETTIERVEVLGPRPLLALEGDSLNKAIAVGMSTKAVLPPGGITAVLVVLSVDQVPRTLTHRVQYRDRESQQPLTVEQPGTPVRQSTLRLRAPLKGDRWLVLNGPSGNNHHTSGFLPYQGRVHVPQRFAIDFVQLDPGGKLYHGDEKDNRNHQCYGAEVLAVASGRVVEVRDGIPENVPDNEKRAVPMTLATVAGNGVVLDLGHAHFAHYGHMQPGSIRVRKGDRVQAGQLLGLVGNSGNSSGPHLHFEISDSSGILYGEGLPFAIDRFTRNGTVVRGEMPRDKWVIDFPER